MNNESKATDSRMVSPDVTTVTLHGRLRDDEVQMFRGAMVKTLGDDASELFHNHTDGGLRYAYPMVQYKIIDGKPAIVGIGSVGETLMRIDKTLRLMIGRQERCFEVAAINIQPYSPSVGESPLMYSLRRYLPLNTDNEARYTGMMSLTDRLCLIEDIITANILAFFKGIGYQCDRQIQTVVSSVESIEPLYYKGVRFRGFDLHFATNAGLPDNIGLGKSPSVGFGTLARAEMPARYFRALGMARRT